MLESTHVEAKTRRKGSPFIVLFSCFVFLLLGVVGNSLAARITITWEPSPTSDVVGYKLYYGNASRSYSANIDVGDTTTYTIDNLQAGKTYYLAATAYDSKGQESDYSKEAVAQIPALPVDSDHDGIADSDEENIYGTDPHKADTDGDGIKDGDELKYWGDRWNADADGDGVINLLDRNPYCARNDAFGDFEYGHTSVTDQWKTVTLENELTDPVVFVGPATMNEADPGVIRLKDVTTTSFDIRFEEWRYLDGHHQAEDVPYLAADAGRYKFPDGIEVEVGTFNLSGTGEWTDVAFGADFPGKPKVFLTIQTYNGSDPLVVRAKNVTEKGFQAAMFEEEAKMDGHVEETIGYLAIYCRNTHGIIDTNYDQIPFETKEMMGDDKGVSAFDSAVKLEEEQSKDSEQHHTDEDIVMISIDGLLFAQISTANGLDTASLRRHDDDAPPAVDFSADPVKGSAPLTVQFQADVIGSVDTYLWTFGDGTTSTEADPSHTYETVGSYSVTLAVTGPNGKGSLTKTDFIQVESVKDDLTLELGEVEINHEWKEVSLPDGFDRPVVIAGVPSYNGAEGGVVRLRKVTSDSFQVRFQEWLYLDGWHTTEDVSYAVFNEGRYQLADGTVIEVGTFSLSETGKWSTQSFGGKFDHAPALFLTVQTYNGSDTVTVRAKKVTTDGFQAALFEEEARMDGHVSEKVGYLAVYSPNESGTWSVDGVDVSYEINYAEVGSHLTSIFGEQLVEQEEQSKDEETDHLKETVAVLILDDTYTFAQDVSCSGNNTAALRRKK